VAVQSKPVRPRAPAHPRRATHAAPTPAMPTPARRRSDVADATVAPPRPDAPPPTSPMIAGRSSGAGGLSRGDHLFLTFFVATMIMVGAVVLVGAVDQMWVLVPVMLVDLTVTFALIATLVSLIGDDGGPSA
jgi:hypothetical protein